MSTEQQVITIDDISADNAPAIYVTGGLNQFLQAVTAEVTAEVPDLTTRKGRDRIASLAAKVSKSKTAVEKPGRDYLKRLKEMPKVVETELREFVTQMDALRDATRKPLTDWEAADVARRDKHTDRIDWLRNRDDELITLSADAIKARIAEAEGVEIGPKWEEFEAEAAREKDKVLTALRAGLIKQEEYDAQQADIARLNAEKAEREQQERDAEIARQAVERAQRESDQKAQAEREAAAKREQELIDQAAQARRDAEQRQRDADAVAENQALQLKLAAEREERQKLQAEQDRIAGIQRAEQERLAAEQRQAEAVERARLAQVKRQEDAKAEELRQQKAREDDKAHKASINRAALEAFIAGGMPADCARQAVTLIAQHKIPNISIQY
ncbi:hypothetical protein I9H06_16565 [Pseudomonas tremae]|uniref:hypothetical protein n=1 Tax=Pseudomonas tremae TaxID=200454 RepID=UPI001F1CED94|nr:hypothetical protein [Pseudomonas tremae]MCF5714290.1 hypothetical protein [Pseudomonas tremae]UQB29979.1 hypothetical protein I9H06_16565 [Pseudomonas tremae]